MRIMLHAHRRVLCQALSCRVEREVITTGTEHYELFSENWDLILRRLLRYNESKHILLHKERERERCEVQENYSAIGSPDPRKNLPERAYSAPTAPPPRKFAPHKNKTTHFHPALFHPRPPRLI